MTARVFYGWLIDHEVRPDNPAARLPIPTIPRAKPRPPPLDEVRAILDGATDPMMGAWVRLGLFAGLRVGEIARLCPAGLSCARSSIGWKSTACSGVS